MLQVFYFVTIENLSNFPTQLWLKFYKWVLTKVYLFKIELLSFISLGFAQLTTTTLGYLLLITLTKSQWNSVIFLKECTLKKNNIRFPTEYLAVL